MKTTTITFIVLLALAMGFLGGFKMKANIGGGAVTRAGNAPVLTNHVNQ